MITFSVVWALLSVFNLYLLVANLNHAVSPQNDETLSQWQAILVNLVMGSDIGLPDDFDGAALQRLARFSKKANEVGSLLTVAHLYHGSNRSEVAKIDGVTLQSLHDWVIHSNSDGPDGLATRKAPGGAPILNDEQRVRLAEILEAGPIAAGHGVVR